MDLGWEFERADRGSVDRESRRDHAAAVLHARPRPVFPIARKDARRALRNALRYFHPSLHAVLGPEFQDELKQYGHIYMSPQTEQL